MTVRYLSRDRKERVETTMASGIKPVTALTEYVRAFGTVLIVGATGGLGTAAVKRFVDGGCTVTLFGP